MTASVSDQAKQIASAFAEESKVVAGSPTPTAVEELRLKFLGRKGQLAGLMESLKTCPKEERPVAGKAINALKQQLEAKVEELKQASAAHLIQAKLDAPPIDVSLPVEPASRGGSLHPVTLMRRTLAAEFRHLGFTIYDGPEADCDFFNFTALNMPDYHPARDMQDTFYLAGKENMVLRTHTSNIQIHCMLQETPPLRMVSMGRTYRCDSDPTHTPMFHQVEGFIVDRDINFAHLKGTIDAFLKAVYGKDLKTRFRPSYFPFVEPGAEMDLQCVLCRGKGCRLCKDTGWLELGGCGMIHPNVFENVEYDSEHYTGFAFGFGLDRMAMLKYQLDDLRTLFEGNDRFLRQFPQVN